MNIQNLKYFLKVAEIGQITEAAEKIHITQPALSRCMRRLEKELGVVLFSRTNQGLKLTDTGVILNEKGKWLLRGYKDMLSTIQDANTGTHGTVRIGTGYPTIPIMSDMIVAVRSEHPDIEFRITQEDPDELIELLKKDKVDVIFLPRPFDDESFECISLQPDPLVLVINSLLDPMPNEEEIPLEALEGMPLCMLRRGDLYGYNDILFAECQRQGVNPRVLCQCNSAATILVLVAQGLGMSYQPKTVVDSMSNSHLYGKKIKDFERFTYPVILLNRNTYISGATRTFLCQLQSACPILEEELKEVTDFGKGKRDPEGNRTFPGDANRF